MAGDCQMTKGYLQEQRGHQEAMAWLDEVQNLQQECRTRAYPGMPTSDIGTLVC